MRELDEVESDGGDAPVDQLKADVPLDPNVAPPVADRTLIDETPAQRIQNAQAKLQEEQATQAGQNTLWRRILFWGIVAVVIFVVLLDAAVMIGYLFVTKDNPNSIVLSTWFGSSVVQVVGLLLVITRHLFPESTPSK